MHDLFGGLFYLIIGINKMSEHRRIYLKGSFYCEPELKYTIQVLFWHYGLKVSFVTDLSDAECVIDNSESGDLIFNESLFLSAIEGVDLTSEFVSRNGVFYMDNGRPDYLFSAFYMLSCAQELGVKQKDEFGRFRYKDSVQYKMNIGAIDLVSGYFDRIVMMFPKLGLSLNKSKRKKKLFLSHDIDLLYGSIIQDSFSCIKRFDISNLLIVLLKNIFVKPQWMNMREIIEIEAKYGFSSTFFWLPVYGKSKYGVMNADYKIQDKRVLDLMELVSVAGWENGLHKSISDMSLSSEIGLVKNRVMANRYHFLAFDPHMDFIRLENAGISFDSSLSFAEVPGYRNGYSRPYFPYLLKQRRPSNVVESPMHLMDTTFYNYLRINAKDAKDQILNFISSAEDGAVIGLLWHNNFFSDYKYATYKKIYEEILIECSTLDIASISSMSIVKEMNYGY